MDTITESAAVSLVKSGNLQVCSTATVGEMADAFMDSPRWSDFVSASGDTVVELSGGITYDGIPASARIQFVVDEAAGTFSAEWLGIDEVDQSLITMSALFNKMCQATF